MYDYEPQGSITPDQVLTLSFYGPQTELPQPTAPTLSSGTVAPGGTLTVNWQGYSCPAGEGSPGAYTLTAVNGTFSNGQNTMPFDTNTRQAQLSVPNNASGTVLVTYTVTCTGGPSGERTSGNSPEAQAAIQAAPSPSPSDDNGGGEGGGDDGDNG